VPILDSRGRPIEKADIERREGRVRTFPEPTSWQRSVATGMDPQRMASLLRNADAGDQLDFLSLAIEMEERDLEYFSKLQQRMNACVFVPVRLEPKDAKDKKSGKFADECNELVVHTPNFTWFLLDLVDALSKGYSVVQPIWDTTVRPWVFSEFVHHDSRHFQFSEDRRELRVRSENKEYGNPIPFDCLVHWPRVRTGVRLRPRGSLARMAAVNWLFKTCTVTDWMAFAEVYGMPLRLGHYNPATATEEEISTMHQALVNLGHDAAALIPTSMKIEFPDARRPASGENIFKGLIEYFDGQTTKAILGQVLALDARATGLGQAVADLHTAVRQDLRIHDSLALHSTVWPLLQQWIEFNHGTGASAGIKLVIDVTPPEDLAKFTSAILPWMQHAGIEVPKRWLFKKLQIPELQPGEESIKAPLAPGTPGSGAPVPGLKST
jgi:phage gp29-like protein